MRAAERPLPDRGRGDRPLAASAHRADLRCRRVGRAPFLSMEFVSGGNLAQKPWKPAPAARRPFGRPRPGPGRPQGTRNGKIGLATSWKRWRRTIQLAHHRGTCTATSRPPTSYSRRTAYPRSRTLASPSTWTRRPQTKHRRDARHAELHGPEQASGKTRASARRTDVYALGDILYEMLTGRPPFQGETSIETLMGVMSRDAVLPSQLMHAVPRNLESICMKCLEKKPQHRYTSALDFAEDLHRFRNDLPINARQMGGSPHRPLAPPPSARDDRPRFPEHRRRGHGGRHAPRGPAEAERVAAPRRNASSSTTASSARARSDEHGPRPQRARLRSSGEGLAGLRWCPESPRLPGCSSAFTMNRCRPRAATARRCRAQPRGAAGAEGLDPRRCTALSEVTPEDRIPEEIVTTPLAAKVKDIFINKCRGCHNPDEAGGGIRIINHDMLVKKRIVVIPGNPDASELFRLIAYEEDPVMPPRKRTRTAR